MQEQHTELELQKIVHVRGERCGMVWLDLKPTNRPTAPCQLRADTSTLGEIDLNEQTVKIVNKRFQSLLRKA